MDSDEVYSIFGTFLGLKKDFGYSMVNFFVVFVPLSNALLFGLDWNDEHEKKVAGSNSLIRIFALV